MSLSLKRKRLRDTGLEESRNESVVSKRRNYNGNLTQTSNMSQSQYLEEDSRRCGKILRIHLTNFMCHENFTINFHPRVNFLVGRNGSGKSAILAALVLGLGGKAKATNRSNNVKGFIKNGETKAKIEIVIANDGPQPYEPDTFGDKITIERTISTTSGSYVIKNENGVVVSKKMDDLQRILMYHNIQVDNPVFVLNQDSAREFLKELEPSKNYTLFLKATQIDVVMEKLNECLHLHRAHMHELDIYKTRLNKQRSDIKEDEEKLREIESFEKLKDELMHFEIAYAWLLVTQKENLLKEIDEKLEKYQKKEEELLQTIQNKDQVNLVINEEIRKICEKISKKNSDYQNENTEFRQIKNKVDEQVKLFSECKDAIDSLKKKKARLEQQIEELNLHIEERSKGNQEDVDAKQADNARIISEYRNQCETHLVPMIDNLKHELKLLNDNKSQKEQIVIEIKRKQRECQHEIESRKVQIDNVKASLKNKLLIYGDYMPALIYEIRAAYNKGKFSQLPRGPIGNYVEVPRRQYRDIVENIIRGFLNAFIVNNTKDRQMLEGILAKYTNTLPRIITVGDFRNEVYEDVGRGCVHPPPDTVLLMNEIKCSDPVVMNCLIDRIRIETVLLTNKKDIAENITSIQQNVPRNLSKVIAITDENISLEYHPMPKYRMYSTKIKQANIIQVNIDERIRNLINEKSNLEREYKKLEVDLNHIGKQIPEDLKNIQAKRIKLQQHENQVTELREKISDLQNVEYTDYSKEIEYLKKEMQENIAKLEEVDCKQKQRVVQWSNLEAEKKLIEEKFKAQEEVLKEIQNEIETLKSQSHQLKMKLRSINDQESLNCDKLTELKSKLNNIHVERGELLKSLETVLEKARGKGPRISTDMTLEQLPERIAKIKAQLKHGMPVNVDPNTISELIDTKKEALEADVGTFGNMNMSIHMLRKSLKFRFDFLKKLKEHMAVMLQLSFNMILKLRNFEGTIDIDHQNQTLKISVVPRDHNKNAVSSTNALSGGERSYSTVAFLISLWSCVNHPFYFLDEYDVFTDEVNREYMTRLLIDEGRKRILRQYSFLTPQDMTLTPESFIKIQNLDK